MNSEKQKEIIIPVMGPDQEIETPKGEDGDKENQSQNECMEKLVRLQAEFSNFRKRVEKEKANLFSVSKGTLVQKLLPVIDNMERMLSYTDDQNQSDHSDGIALIYKNLIKILTDEGLKEIDAKGEYFNPEIHEAVDVGAADKDNDNKVLQVWQKGYYFNERMLRPSKVKVGRCFEAAEE